MQFSPGAVGKGHFVINILKNQIIWTVEMGWMVAHGQACWRGRAVAVVILGFCFVLNLGDCGLMGEHHGEERVVSGVTGFHPPSEIILMITQDVAGPMDTV